jgi:prevent-host-death family protein
MQLGLREANQHFSKIIKAVRKGEEVLLTDRGRPLARVTPIPGMSKLEAALDKMAAEGLLRRAEKRRPMPHTRPIRIRGGPLSGTVSDGRDER